MEKVLQYVWQHRLWLAGNLHTVSDKSIEILDPGIVNTASGPDFFNAKIKIDNRTWIGNVEIHMRASDWYRHGHNYDKAYDNVVLHVVDKSDCTVSRSDGQEIEQISLPHCEDLYERYRSLVGQSLNSLECSEHICNIDDIYLKDWLNTLSIERLQRKSAVVANLVKENAGDWNEALYVTLSRALGFGLNSEPFERLARSLPLKLLCRHADSPETIEALLFGMAGFLSGDKDNDYYRFLQQEFEFYKVKYGLIPSGCLGWKSSGMRPQNFPHRRIATLAAILGYNFTTGNILSACTDIDSCRRMFDITLYGYWSTSYSFESDKSSTPRALSRSSIDSLIINAIIPFMYAYGSMYAKEEYIFLAMELLDSLPPENNFIIRIFADKNIKCRNAAESQALIEMRKNYCEVRKCLYCRIGHRYMSKHSV